MRSQESGVGSRELGGNAFDSTSEAGMRRLKGTKIIRLSAHDEVQNRKSKIQNPKSLLPHPSAM